MQGSKNDVARFSRGNGSFDGFQVTHFADEDDVRILSQRAAQGLGETWNVDADLTLIDRRRLVGMVVLDGVFQRDDVVVHVLVDVGDHAGQSRRLTTSGRPGHQHQAAWPSNHLGDDCRRPQLLERQELVGNPPQHHGDGALLLEDGDTKACLASESKPEVGATHLLQFLLVTLRTDTLHQGNRVFRFQ